MLKLSNLLTRFTSDDISMALGMALACNKDGFN
jgi:hypothetical protein